MSRFDFNLLAVLEALLTERNVTRAAARIHVTQPTMSGMLQRLREQFADQLLIRVGRNFELTPLGLSLIDPVREALRSVQAVVETVPIFSAAASTRTFRVMASDYCISTFLSRVVGRLATEAIGMHLEMLSLDLPLDKLMSGDIDICIVPNDMTLFNREDNADILHSEPLFSDTFTCVVDRDHPLQPPVTVEEYFGYPHVGLDIGGDAVSVEAAPMRRERPGFRPNFTVPNFLVIPYLVAGTQIIGVVQRRLAAVMPGSLPLRTFDPPFVIPKISEVLLWHRRQNDDPGHRWLRQVFFDEAPSSNWFPMPRESSAARAHVV